MKYQINYYNKSLQNQKIEKLQFKSTHLQKYSNFNSNFIKCKDSLKSCKNKSIQKIREFKLIKLNIIHYENNKKLKFPIKDMF